MARDTLRPRTVVLLHGWTMRGSVFDDLIARLPAGFDCHAPDLPGHGDQATVEPSLAAAAQTLADLLETHDLNEVVLVGWSMGAAVAWQFIETFGANRIAGLMTVDMSPKLACGPDWAHGLIGQSAGDLETSTRRMISNWPAMAEAIATTMFGRRDGAPGYSRADALRQILSNDPAKMITMWKALTDMDKREVVNHLPFPLVATCGALSRVYPASAARWLAETAPHGAMHVFAASGHSAHLEEPEAFAARLIGFAGNL